MPVSVDPKGEGSQAEKGVYPAKYAYMGEELKDLDWSPLERAIIQFELIDKDDSAPYSVAAGDELVHVIWQMTGKKIPLGSEEQTFEAAVEALKGCTWEGLINIVGKKGFIDRLQIPSGGYNFRFVRFQTRDEKGRAGWFERVWKEGEKPTKNAIIDLVVVGGQFDGWLQSCFLPITFRADALKNDLQITGNALAQVLAASGVTKELLVAEVEAVEAGGGMYFETVEQPLPELEALMVKLAVGGHLISGTVDAEGKTPWGALVPAGVGMPATPGQMQTTQTQPAQAPMTDERRLRGLMEAVSERMWGGEEPVFMPDGALAPTRGMYLAVNVIKVVAETMPESGVECKWPPIATGWTDQGLALAVNVFASLSVEDESALIKLVGDSSASHKALAEYVRDAFGTPAADQQF